MRTPRKGPGAGAHCTAPRGDDVGNGSVRLRRPAISAPSSVRAGVEAGNFDVGVPAGLPNGPGSGPTSGCVPGTLTREEHRTVGLVPVGPADRRRRGVVLESTRCTPRSPRVPRTRGAAPRSASPCRGRGPGRGLDEPGAGLDRSSDRELLGHDVLDAEGLPVLEDHQRQGPACGSRTAATSSTAACSARTGATRRAVHGT